MNIKIDVIVTRHSALVQYLREQGIVDDSVRVIPHATAEDVRGKNVLGVLPHSLSCLTKTFTEIPLHLTPEMRGKELTLEDVRKVAGKPATYIVRKIEEA